MKQVTIGSKTLLPGCFIVFKSTHYLSGILCLWRKPTGEVLFTSSDYFVDDELTTNHYWWVDKEETKESGFLVACDVQTVEQANEIIEYAKLLVD